MKEVKVKEKRKILIKNNKGFAITEILILSTVITGILLFMYSQFKNINRSYQTSFIYDTVEGMYLANNDIHETSSEEDEESNDDLSNTVFSSKIMHSLFNKTLTDSNKSDKNEKSLNEFISKI